MSKDNPQVARSRTALCLPALADVDPAREVARLYERVRETCEAEGSEYSQDRVFLTFDMQVFEKPLIPSTVPRV